MTSDIKTYEKTNDMLSIIQRRDKYWLDYKADNIYNICKAIYLIIFVNLDGKTIEKTYRAQESLPGAIFLELYGKKIARYQRAKNPKLSDELFKEISRHTKDFKWELVSSEDIEVWKNDIN